MLMEILLKSFHAIHGTYGRNSLSTASSIINQEFNGNVITKVIDDNHMEVLYFDDNGDKHIAELEVDENGEVMIGEDIPNSYHTAASIKPS